MKNTKFAAKLLLFVITFSIATSLLPVIGAFANMGETKPAIKKAAHKTALIELLGQKPESKSEVVTAVKTEASSSGSKPVEEVERIITKKLSKAGEGDFEDIKEEEVNAIKNKATTDMCDRHNNAVSGPKFIEDLLFLVGDSSSRSEGISNVKAATWEDMLIQPEMVPFTQYDCFPEQWKKKYSEQEWSDFQNLNGTKSCGTFELTCHVEQLLKSWIRSAIVTGMTWILDIATGSGSGDAATACRPGRGADGSIDSQASEGFTRSQAIQCSNFLRNYYAMPEVGHSNSHTEGQLIAIGLQQERNPDSNYTSHLGNAAEGSGATSINYESEATFYGKSSSIGYIIAVAMVIGAVIQAMIQSKPAVIFKVVIIYIPIFGLSLWMAPTLSKYLLEFTDGIAYFMADNSSHDISNVAGAFGMTVGTAVKENYGGAGVATIVAGGLMMDIMSKALMLLLIVAGVFILQGIALWALMMFREASILMVLALLPISLSMAIWPSLAKISHKFIKLLVSLIISKIPIVMSLSMGINMLSEWVDKHKDAAGGLGAGNDGMRQFVLAMAVFMIALAAPTFVISLFDAVGDMGQVLGGKLHTGAFRTAQQVAGIKGGLTNMGRPKNAMTGIPGVGGSGGVPGATALGAGGSQGGGAGGGLPGQGGAGSTGPGASQSTNSGAGAGQPGQNTSGSPLAGNGTGSAPEPAGGFGSGYQAAGDQISQTRDIMGRPNSQFFNGGFGQKFGSGLVARAQYNQRVKNAGGASKIKTIKNKGLAVIGQHSHAQGQLNAAGGLKGRAAVANPARYIKNLRSAAKSIDDS